MAQEYDAVSGGLIFILRLTPVAHEDRMVASERRSLATTVLV